MTLIRPYKIINLSASVHDLKNELIYGETEKSHFQLSHQASIDETANVFLFGSVMTSFENDLTAACQFEL